MTDHKSERTYLLSQSCPHITNIEKYNDDNKDFKYYVTSDTENDKPINLCVLEISFYRYLKFVSGTLSILNDEQSSWNSTKAVTFESTLKYNDMETLHNNLLLLFDNTLTIKNILDSTKSSIDYISHFRSNDALIKNKLYTIIKECIDLITSIKSVIEHFELFNLTNQQKGLIVRNLVAYLLCSYTHIPHGVKDVFCTVYPEIFDEIWSVGTYFEEKVTKMSCWKKCFSCCCC